MARAGINIAEYKAHSTRSAVVSKANNLGATVKQILDLGNWTNAMAFRRFSEREVDDSSHIPVQAKLLSLR